MKHCLEDVRYTKMLYEEKIWEVPVTERVSKKQRWDNFYDDDINARYGTEKIGYPRLILVCPSRQESYPRQIQYYVQGARRIKYLCMKLLECAQIK
jgi:hypothetical protein